MAYYNGEPVSDFFKSSNTSTAKFRRQFQALYKPSKRGLDLSFYSSLSFQSLLMEFTALSLRFRFSLAFAFDFILARLWLCQLAFVLAFTCTLHSPLLFFHLRFPSVVLFPLILERNENWSKPNSSPNPEIAWFFPQQLHSRSML